MTQRPNGKSLMRVGGLALLVGLIALVAHGLVSGFMPMDQYPVEHWSQYVEIWAPIIFTFGLPLGAFAWLIGYLIFAISFLPSKEDQNAKD